MMKLSVGKGKFYQTIRAVDPNGLSFGVITHCFRGMIVARYMQIAGPCKVLLFSIGKRYVRKAGPGPVIYSMQHPHAVGNRVENTVFSTGPPPILEAPG